MIKFLFLLIIVIESQAQDLKDVELCFYGESLAARKCLNILNVKDNFSSCSKVFYDPGKENLIFIMGWQPKGSNTSRDAVLSAFFAHKRDEYNIGEIDWGKYVITEDPTKVLPYINPVIGTVSQIISEMYAQRFKPSKTYVIGKFLKN